MVSLGLVRCLPLSPPSPFGHLNNSSKSTCQTRIQACPPISVLVPTSTMCTPICPVIQTYLLSQVLPFLSSPHSHMPHPLSSLLLMSYPYQVLSILPLKQIPNSPILFISINIALIQDTIISYLDYHNSLRTPNYSVIALLIFFIIQPILHTPTTYTPHGHGKIFLKYKFGHVAPSLKILQQLPIFPRIKSSFFPCPTRLSTIRSWLISPPRLTACSHAQCSSHTGFFQ